MRANDLEMRPETTARSQIQFSPSGQWFVVTERLTDIILIFDFDPMRGLLPNPAVVHASSGATPFGFDFAADDLLVVAEASMCASGAGSVSSYRIGSDPPPA